ncbi:hypothetical protein FPF71_04540 [Algibacter amylolyticus]|uniref:Uncharacterized protein n=1 Tax=Algibacter amylolyticus TaxID=1608400 RepID=A0A5M7BIX8_9FLAO|nr:hypothetical protein [Algibacter amylolyticus]KAA5828107.1 hypothetical protein F2B50_04540 [Algibacter amylolyticus]MBB5267355.1 hypothetical protein [Algibacter amylolyticus]TSJ82352.1 hypothetical protein FPF71_04540 [Algibacter amylolyticus]
MPPKEKYYLYLFLFLFKFSAFSQVGIGTTDIDASAILEVYANDKGVLFPNVALMSNTDQTTIPSPVDGVLVYNTGLGALAYVGYVFWNGSEWRTLLNKSSGSGSIDYLNCSNVSLAPSSYSSGVAYNGTMTISYLGGDGGTFPEQSIGPINGLTATLAAGNFNTGAGDLVYSVTGTPTITSPNTTSFNVNTGGQSCTAIVGGEKRLISDYAQVSFDAYGSGSRGISLNGELATILPGSINVARVKRLDDGVFRVDFVEPFDDTAYVVSGFGFEPGYYNNDSRQPYLYVPNYTRSTNDLGDAILADNDVRPTNPTNSAYGLETRQTVVKSDGYTSAVARYRTHFYFIEGYSHYPLAGASLSITR